MPEECQPAYQFQIDVDINPVGPQVKIGDTLVIKSSISNPIVDQNSGFPIELGNTFTFPLTNFIGKVDSAATSSALYDFDIQYHKGDFSIFDIGSVQTLDSEYAINGKIRELAFSIVPQKLGIYFIEISYLTISYTEDFLQIGDNSCREGTILIIRTNNGQSNYDLVEASFSAENIDSTSFHNLGGYAFEVIE